MVIVFLIVEDRAMISNVVVAVLAVARNRRKGKTQTIDKNKLVKLECIKELPVQKIHRLRLEKVKWMVERDNETKSDNSSLN